MNEKLKRELLCLPRNELQELLKDMIIIRHNKPSAGRKPKFPAETQSKIICEYCDGSTMRELSEKYGCSMTTIHNIVTLK